MKKIAIKKIGILAIALVLSACTVGNEGDIDQFSSVDELISSYDDTQTRHYDIPTELRNVVELKSSDIDTTDSSFGSALAISADGTRIIVGAKTAFSNGNIYNFSIDVNNDSINYDSTSGDSAGTTYGGLTGNSVAINLDGSVQVFGSPYFNTNQGAIGILDSIYNLQVENAYTAGDYAGYNVAVSRDASNDGSTMVWRGATKIFIRKGSQGEVSLDADINTTLHSYGAPIRISANGEAFVALTADTILQTYHYNNYIYSWDSSPVPGSFTASYDMSDDGLTLAAVRNSTPEEIWIYKRNNIADNFDIYQNVIADNSASKHIVSLSGDGKQILIGLPDEVDNANIIGRVDRYRFIGGDWQLKESYRYPNGITTKRFGSTLDQDYTGKRFIVGCGPDATESTQALVFAFHAE